ncbi:MAG: acyltransferase family protein [Bacilli bacterium]|nr:acyltransferase family protein [Bacilli bacterium]
MRERIYKFDNIKFLLILLVVIGHSVEFYIDKYNSMNKIFIFIYSFHMPLFIFLSGLFQKKIYHFKDLPLKKLCYYFYLIVIMFVLFVLSNKMFGVNLSFNFISSFDVHWYLVVLIIYILMVPIISRLNLNILFIISFILGCFVGFDNRIGDFLCLSRVIVFFPFFCLGFIFSDKKETLIKITNNIICKFLSICVIIFFLYICYRRLDLIWKYKSVFTGRNAFNLIQNIPNCSFKHRFITYMISLAMGFSIMCVIPNIKFKLFTKLGKRTLQVYVFHRSLLYVCFNMGLFNKLERIFGEKLVFVMILIGIIITLLLSIKPINKIMNKFCDMILYKKEVQLDEK